MNPFYWHEGIPEKTGWYLCAWTMGDGAIYDVGKWDGSEWLTFAKGEPNLFHKITPPHEFFEELEREATDRQRLHVTATTDEDEDATNHLPLLGAN
tara:strand:- start:105 stop:392 length:288 start_codon:yes stop_codon:yes gene_type:complete